MLHQNLRKLVSFSFISFCFCLGLGIGLFIRFGQLERTNASTTSTETEPIPFSIPEYTSPDTITIQAVGDIIPGTNYPNYKLPRNRNLLFPNSVRAYLQKSNILFGNFQSSLTNYPYSPKDITPHLIDSDSCRVQRRSPF
mgnify:CR=1 FL=1